MCASDRHRYCDACRAWECEVRPHLGYQVPERVAVLTFDGTEYQGAEVRVLLNPSYEVVGQLDGTAVLERLKIFGDKIIVGWNLERDGRPIPADGYHYIQQPADFSDLIHMAWISYYTQQNVEQPELSDDIGELPIEPVVEEFDRPVVMSDLDLDRFQTVEAA